MKKLSIASALVVGFSLIAAGSAQAVPSNSATANATADIVAAISIAKTADLRFGQVIPDIASVVGTVTIAPDSSRTQSIVVLAGGTFGAASFGVTGTASATYAITLPTSITVTNATAGAPMTVDSFVSNPSGTGILTSGAQTLQVGATLHVGAAQVPNQYSGTFNVSVDYN